MRVGTILTDPRRVSLSLGLRAAFRIASSRNRKELHIYDVGSVETPLPCIRLRDSRVRDPTVAPGPPEGISRVLFLPTSPGRNLTRILAGGNRGTVRMWTIPTSSRRRRAAGTAASFGDLGAPQCAWSFPAFGSGCEGVCDMLALGSNDDDYERVERSTTTTTAASSYSPPPTKSLVLLAGDGSSLVLLDAERCTRKAFSTMVTPTIVASWDLYRLMSRELSKVDAESRLPARGWMAAHGMRLLRRECSDHDSSFEVGIVSRCGWMFVVDLRVPHRAAASPDGANPSQAYCPALVLRLSILHRTPRIRCYNSLNEPLATLGGMALQFSMPEMHVPLTSLRQDMVWLGDVKQMRYTMPSKDKYVLSEGYGISSSPKRSASAPGLFRHPGEGLILARFGGLSSSFANAPGGDGGEKQMRNDARVHARLPLSGGSPLTLAAHPSGDWMVIGYGMNNRGVAATKQIELVSLRRKSPACG